MALICLFSKRPTSRIIQEQYVPSNLELGMNTFGRYLQLATLHNLDRL